MKAVFILNPLEMILNKPNHFDPFAIVFLYWQRLGKYGHIFIVQKRKGKLSLTKAASYVVRLSSLDLEIIVGKLVYILIRFCLIIDNEIFQVIRDAKMLIGCQCFLMIIWDLYEKALVNPFNNEGNALSISLNPS